MRVKEALDILADPRDPQQDCFIVCSYLAKHIPDIRYALEEQEEEIVPESWNEIMLCLDTLDQIFEGVEFKHGA